MINHEVDTETSEVCLIASFYYQRVPSFESLLGKFLINTDFTAQKTLHHEHHSGGAPHLFPLISNCLKFWEETEPSDSSAMIRLFIQDNFCDFVNPVTMTSSPLILPPSIILPFSWPHHKYWSSSPDVVINLAKWRQLCHVDI